MPALLPKLAPSITLSMNKNREKENACTVYPSVPVRERMKRFQKMDGLKEILVCLMMVAMIKMVHGDGHGPVRHDVGGGRYSWKLNVNFSDWSTHQRFYVGDWLYFGFDRNLYSVLEVNKTSYEKCNENDFITNITRGGRDVFELKEAKSYYFISGRGFCFQGMKVAVNVEDIPPPTPAPSPEKSGSPLNSWSQSFLPLLATLVFFIFLSKY